MKSLVKSKIIKTSAVYIISSILIKCIVFLTMPTFTRILSVSDYGVYNTYIAYEGVLNILYAIGAVFAIRNARFEFEHDFKTFKKSLIDLEFTIFILSLVIIILFKDCISRILGLDTILVLCLAFHSFGSALIVLFTQVFQINYETKRVVLLSLITTTMNIGCSLLLINLVFVNDKYIGKIIGSSIAPILFLIFIAAIYLSKKEKVLETKYWKYIFCIGLPALPTIIAENLIIQGDRIMIDRMVGDYEAGIYGTISTVGMILTVILNAVISALVPWFYRKLKEEEYNDVIKVMDYSLLFAGVLASGFGMMSPEIVRIFTGKVDYWNNSRLLILFSIMNLFKFGSVELATFEQFHKKNIYPTLGVGGSCIINITFNYMIIPVYGYEVAAITSIFAMGACFIYHIIITKCMKYKYYNLFHVTIICIVFTLLLIADYIMVDRTIIRYAINLFLLIILGIIAVFKRNKIRHFLSDENV